MRLNDRWHQTPRKAVTFVTIYDLGLYMFSSKVPGNRFSFPTDCRKGKCFQICLICRDSLFSAGKCTKKNWRWHLCFWKQQEQRLKLLTFCQRNCAHVAKLSHQSVNYRRNQHRPHFFLVFTPDFTKTRNHASLDPNTGGSASTSACIQNVSPSTPTVLLAPSSTNSGLYHLFAHFRVVLCPSQPNSQSCDS